MPTEQTLVTAVAAAGITSTLQSLGVDPGVAIAAAIGAVGLLAVPNHGLTARQALAAVALGFFIGLYGAVPLTQYLNRPEGWKYIAALVLAACGYRLLGGLVKVSRKPVDILKDLKP